MSAGGIPGCSAPADGYVDNGDDCDDDDDTLHPGMDEVCDDIDNDCDGLIDDDDDSILVSSQNIYYADNDSDGQGSTISGTIAACSTPDGYADNADDCNDSDETAYEGATEIPGNDIDEDCDGIDNINKSNCTDGLDDDNDGSIDCADSDCQLACVDTDGDGELSIADGGTDCDDNNSAINTSATEICDGIDNDCIGGIDDGLTAYPFYVDEDGDGFGDGDKIPVLEACYNADDMKVIRNMMEIAGMSLHQTQVMSMPQAPTLEQLLWMMVQLVC